jgi:hypothetical protein
MLKRIKYKDPNETEKTKEIREQKKYFQSISKANRQPTKPKLETISDTELKEILDKKEQPHMYHN